MGLGFIWAEPPPFTHTSFNLFFHTYPLTRHPSVHSFPLPSLRPSTIYSFTRSPIYIDFYFIAAHPLTYSTLISFPSPLHPPFITPLPKASSILSPPLGSLFHPSGLFPHLLFLPLYLLAVQAVSALHCCLLFNFFPLRFLFYDRSSHPSFHHTSSPVSLSFAFYAHPSIKFISVLPFPSSLPFTFYAINSLPQYLAFHLLFTHFVIHLLSYPVTNSLPFASSLLHSSFHLTSIHPLHVSIELLFLKEFMIGGWL